MVTADLGGPTIDREPSMERVDIYLAAAKTSSLQEFVTAYEGYFLIKRPNMRGASQPAPATIAYETVLTRLEVDPFATEWRIVPVKKRPGNPYPDRLSVGRAPNCDVVLRLPSISKVHAHLLVQPDNSFCLRDNQASNQTYLNGRKLEPGTTAKLAVGDSIALGSLTLEFVDAKLLHRMLCTQVSE